MPINFHQGQYIGRRDEQQDALGNLVLNAHTKLYVLADGMGGHQGGQLASTTVVDAFLAFFQNRNTEGDWANALRQALDAANFALAEHLRTRPELSGMGTTVIAVVVDEAAGRYHYISVGDSPLYGFQTGRLARINANHAFAEDLKKWQDAGEISAEQAAQHPARHAVTSAVMGKDIPLTDDGSGELGAGDWLLLASDGLQTLSDAAGGEIEALLAAGGTAEKQVSRLLAAVKNKALPQQDNTSVVLIQAGMADGKADAAPTQVLPPPVTAAKTEENRRPGRFLGGLAAAGLLLAAGWWLWLRPTPSPTAPAADEAPASAPALPTLPSLPASAALPPASEAVGTTPQPGSDTASQPQTEH